MARHNGFSKKRVYSQCARKKGFSTTREVNQIIHKTRTHEGIKLQYYYCPVCGKYHLTKKFVRSKF